MPKIHLPEVTIYYEDVGAGAPLLLIHGDWSCAAEMLAVHHRLWEGRRLIIPDRRGYGRSTRLIGQPSDVYGVHAVDMATLLGHLGLSAVDVHGFSGGGIVAVRLALTQPELVRSLVLECSHYSADMPPIAREWFRTLSEEPDSLPASAQQALVICHGEDYWKQVLRNFSEACLRIFFQGGNIYAGRLRELKCPALILHAGRDPFITVEHAQALQQEIPGATLHVVPRGRHGLFDRSGRHIAEECRGRVVDFWDSLAAAHGSG